MKTTKIKTKMSGLLLTAALFLAAGNIQSASARSRPDNRGDARWRIGKDTLQPANPDSAAKIRALLEKVQQAYHRAAYLGFRMKYLYANEGQPGKNIDSLIGEVEMDKNRSRFVIDGTETVLTDKYAIQVRSEDKAIYLSAAKQATMSNPLGMLENVVGHMQGVQAELRQQGTLEVLVLRFPPGSAYSSIQMQVDARTGFFKKITYSLYTEGLVGQELIDRPGHPGPYESRGQVSVVFSQYEQGRFDDSLFKEENFFSKTAGRFVPAGRYNEYHIFLASSNL
ncbi:MAG TPA: hypothetical protein VNS58_05125 [Puia sp.]|nr:hypothetical protein [Puia sp.]